MQADGVIGKYAIGGAVGATFYLEPSATLDIDVFVSLPKLSGSSLLTLSPMYEWLAARGHKAEKEYVVIEGWPVQFLPASDALDEEALARAVETEVEGIRTWVMTAEHLVAIALRTGRAKDCAVGKHSARLADSASQCILEFVERGVIQSDKLDKILKRHGLLAKWGKFGDRFLEGSE
jgi:hypothetical protein